MITLENNTKRTFDERRVAGRRTRAKIASLGTLYDTRDSRHDL